MVEGPKDYRDASWRQLASGELPTLSDPDLLEAVPFAIFVLGECLRSNLPKDTVEQALDRILSTHPTIAGLSERQRILLWSMCQSAIQDADKGV